MRNRSVFVSRRRRFAAVCVVLVVVVFIVGVVVGSRVSHAWADVSAAQAAAVSTSDTSDTSRYRAWVSSLPNDLADVPACETETGEDLSAETQGDTVYMPVCVWRAGSMGNHVGTSVVLAYGQPVLALSADDTPNA